MNNIPLTDATREIGKPLGWDDTLDGPCLTISVHDTLDERTGIPFMTTAWRPDDDELALLNAGAPLFLAISGKVHPVIKLFVAASP